MKTQEAYKEKMTTQLKEWDAQVNLLEAKIANAGADIKIRHAEEVQELRDKRKAASEKMKELGKSSGDAWETVKKTADNLWDDLKAGMSEAQSKFK